jgi:hypothetical protein
MKDFRLYVSEVAEEGERISASRILCEIHDAMCMCGVGPDECDTEGIQRTVLEAAQGLIANGKWSTSFEDGWIKVETIEPPVRAELRKPDEWVRGGLPKDGADILFDVPHCYGVEKGRWDGAKHRFVSDRTSPYNDEVYFRAEEVACWMLLPSPPIPSVKTEEQEVC